MNRTARVYGQQASNRNAKTGFTRTQFGNVGRNVDSESEKPKLRMESFANVPKPVEQQRSEDVKDTREELREITDDKEKEVDVQDFKVTEKLPTVRKAARATSDEMISDHKSKGVFAKAWTISDHVTMPQVIQPKKSSFYPNFIAATLIISSIEQIMDGIEELKWICPHYFSLPARVYWSVLFYIQILKAKEAATKLTKPESTWFRAFKRIYPLESLPVVGPLVPFYSNITAAKPNDDMYDFIYPDYNANFGLAVGGGLPSIADSFFIQPNVLMISSFLLKFTQLNIANLGETIPDPANPNQNLGLRYFDVDGNFIPNRTVEAFTFAGIDFPAGLNVPTAQVIANLDMDKPLPESKHRLESILPYWKRSKCSDIPIPGNTNNYDDIGQAMRMMSDFEWFEDCIDMANIQCKFFEDSMNMSQIPSTGGSEVLISAHITGSKPKFKSPKTWFPNNWKNLKAQFRTTRSDVTYEQIFNAGYALSTATISWLNHEHPIGGRQIGHRTGPYWDNRLFQFEQTTDVEVMRRLRTMIRSQFFHAHDNI